MALALGSEALEKRVQQLEEELDFTHAHYHKLLEQVIRPATCCRVTLALLRL